MMKLKVYTAEHHNPHFNLATEDWLFQSTDVDEHILFLWRNQPCIVIGRFQNPWEECNLEAMEADNVILTRRQSGGGAVYHDLGNTNFTFMSPRGSYSKETNFAIIISALKTLGIKAETSGRNDIVVEGKKISGSAFKLNANRAFHHGTLLIRTDLKAISTYLTPDKEKLESKGIKSVASRVANLTSFNQHLTHETLCQAIIDQFFTTYGSVCPIEELTFERLSREPELARTYERYADWQWRFGSTPQFSHTVKHRFPWGMIRIYFDVSEAIVRSSVIYSDALDIGFIESLQSLFIGMQYNRSLIAEKIRSTFVQASAEQKSFADDVADLLMRELS
ncbi:MAG: lipoate--protein ligase [Sphaerochaetaceae bacterium]